MPTFPAADRIKLALSAATDSIKQVLTLSTAILTFSVTFSKDITSAATRGERDWLYAAWILLGLAILSGVWALLALTGMIGRKDEALDIYQGNVRIPAGLQMVSFALALGAVAIFGVLALSGVAPTGPKGGTCSIEAPATGACEVP